MNDRMKRLIAEFREADAAAGRAGAALLDLPSPDNVRAASDALNDLHKKAYALAHEFIADLDAGKIVFPNDDLIPF